MPYHWGWAGLATGDVANDLLSVSEEPNVRIMETKGLLCNITAGRRPRGPAALDRLAEDMRKSA
jgi:formate dehydrogenase major subunit